MSKCRHDDLATFLHVDLRKGARGNPLSSSPNHSELLRVKVFDTASHTRNRPLLEPMLGFFDLRERTRIFFASVGPP